MSCKTPILCCNGGDLVKNFNNKRHPRLNYTTFFTKKQIFIKQNELQPMSCISLFWRRPS